MADEPQPETKPKGGLTNGQILIGLILIIAITCALINAISNALMRPSNSSTSTSLVVEYAIQSTGVDSIEITFTNADLQQETVVAAGSWRHSLRLDPGAAVSLMVRHRESSGRVSCQINTPAGVVARNSREGDNVAALCSATVE